MTNFSDTALTWGEILHEKNIFTYLSVKCTFKTIIFGRDFNIFVDIEICDVICEKGPYGTGLTSDKLFISNT